MKILKNPSGLIYDTANKESIEQLNPRKGFGNLTPLHQTHEKKDYEFLAEHFPPEHQIFVNFSQSYYYALTV